MAKYTFSSGGEKWQVEGKTWQDAIKKAWSVPPENALGILTEMIVDDGPEEYMVTKRLLETCGYVCNF